MYILYAYNPIPVFQYPIGPTFRVHPLKNLLMRFTVTQDLEDE